MTPPSVDAAPRPRVRVVMLRWLLVSLVLTGVIAMHVLSQHDAGGGHHGSMIGEPSTVAVGQDAHSGHDAAGLAAPADVGVPVLTPAVPDDNGTSMAACILFLVIGAGVALLALLAALLRRSKPFAARSTHRLVKACPRGPPPMGPPRISLCVLRV